MPYSPDYSVKFKASNISESDNNHMLNDKANLHLN